MGQHPTPSKDDLPLDGKVMFLGDDRIYIYRGYLASDFNQCAVEPVGGSGAVWASRGDIQALETEETA